MNIKIGEFKIYINNLELILGGCRRCHTEYNDIYFSGYVKEGRKKTSFDFGTFSGRDSNCVCDGPTSLVLCTIYRDTVKKGDDWQFLRFYVNSELANKIIPLTRTSLK
jgi:hypothetical protein